MFVIALALVLVTVACIVVLMEASRSVVPTVGPSHPVATYAVTPGAPTAAPAVPTQRTAGDTARAVAAYGFIADLPAEKNAVVNVNL